MTLFTGLFQSGISLSGTAFQPRAFRYNAPRRTKQLAAFLGCPNECTKKMIECLKTRPAKKIVENVKEFMVSEYSKIHLESQFFF